MRRCRSETPASPGRRPAPASPRRGNTAACETERPRHVPRTRPPSRAIGSSPRTTLRCCGRRPGPGAASESSRVEIMTPAARPVERFSAARKRDFARKPVSQPSGDRITSADRLGAQPLRLRRRTLNSAHLPSDYGPGNEGPWPLRTSHGVRLRQAPRAVTSSWVLLRGRLTARLPGGFVTAQGYRHQSAAVLAVARYVS